MKLFIFGASGAGTTTLGKALGVELEWTHLDADDYYWEKTPIPYEVVIPKTIRHQNLITDFEASEYIIVSGGVMNWSLYWKNAFDYAVWLYIPHRIRMARLRKREIRRYGDLLKTNINIQQKSKEFLAWAASYDDVDFDGKSITRDQHWMKLLQCPTLKIEGDTTIEERLKRVKELIRQ